MQILEIGYLDVTCSEILDVCFKGHGRCSSFFGKGITVWREVGRVPFLLQYLWQGLECVWELDGVSLDASLHRIYWSLLTVVFMVVRHVAGDAQSNHEWKGRCSDWSKRSKWGRPLKTGELKAHCTVKLEEGLDAMVLTSVSLTNDIGQTVPSTSES